MIKTFYTPGCPPKYYVSWFRMWRPCMCLHFRSRRHFVGDRLIVFREVVVEWTVCCWVQFLGAFEKLRKATISFMSVRPPACNNSAPTGRNLKWNLIFGYFSKICRQNSLSIQILQWQVLYLKTNIYFFIRSCSAVARTKNDSDESCTEPRNTHFMFNNFFEITPFIR